MTTHHTAHRAFGLRASGPRFVHAAVTVVMAATIASSCGKTDPAAHAKKADDYVASNMLKEASIEYRAALQINPSLGDVRLKLGDVYLKLADPRAALGEYVRAADLLPGDIQAQLKAGRLLLAAGAFQDAKARAEKAVAIDAKNSDSQILLGNALAGLKDFDGAISQYQEALAIAPAGDVAYRNMGVVQMARGELPAAEATFRKALEVAPKSLQTHLALANFLWAVARRDEAETTLKAALALDPNDLTANRALGMFYVSSGRIPDAEPYFKTIAIAAKTDAAMLGLADYYVIAGRQSDALPILRELTRKPETFASATMRMAAIDVALGERVPAQAKLRDVLEKNPKDMTARVFSARLLAVDGKRDEALALATSVVKDDPESPQATDAYGVIGTVQGAQDRPEDAIKAFREVLKRDNASPFALLALAQLLRARGELAQAETHVTDLLKVAPKYPLARAELVRILLLQGKTAKANEEVSALKRDFPAAPAVLKLVAAQQLLAGQIDAAYTTFSKVAGVAPADLEALGGLVRIDIKRRRPAAAVARAEAAIKSGPASGALFVIAAESQMANGDMLKTEEYLKKAIELEPAKLRAYTLLGVLYASQRRLGDAEKTFQQIVTHNPSSVSAHTMLGILLDGQGRQADATKQYQEILALDPEAPVAANNLAWIILSSKGDLSEALRLAQVAHQRLPDEPNVNDTLGWIHFQQQRYSEAIRFLEASIKAGNPDPTASYHLGMAYAAFGDSAKARTALTRALASKAPFEGRADAEKTLATLN